MPSFKAVDGFSSDDLVNLTGCSYRMLDYWCRVGVIKDNAEGSGTRRYFSKLDLLVSYLIFDLVKLGCGGETLKIIATRLYEKFPNESIGRFLVCDQKGDVYFCDILVTTSEPVWVIPIDHSYEINEIFAMNDGVNDY